MTHKYINLVDIEGYRAWVASLYTEAGELRRKLNPVKSTSRRFQAGTRRTKHATRKRNG